MYIALLNFETRTIIVQCYLPVNEKWEAEACYPQVNIGPWLCTIRRPLKLTWLCENTISNPHTHHTLPIHTNFPSVYSEMLGALLFVQFNPFLFCEANYYK